MKGLGAVEEAGGKVKVSATGTATRQGLQQCGCKNMKEHPKKQHPNIHNSNTQQGNTHLCACSEEAAA
jgi:hypothetical protein